ncbi:MAG: hypothetical protein MHPSP_000754, partial [Paramarteilia canceri]
IQAIIKEELRLKDVDRMELSVIRKKDLDNLIDEYRTLETISVIKYDEKKDFGSSSRLSLDSASKNSRNIRKQSIRNESSDNGQISSKEKIFSEYNENYMVIKPFESHTLEVSLSNPNVDKISWLVLPQFKVEQLKVNFAIKKFGLLLQPKLVFDKVNVINFITDSNQKMAYNLFKTGNRLKRQLGVFSFGHLLIGKNKEKFTDSQLNSTFLKFKNVSSERIEINCQLGSKNSHFYIDPISQYIDPKQTAKIKLMAFPKHQEDYKDIVYIYSKEWPNICQFRVEARGVKPEVSLTPTMLNFDKVLLHRSIEKKTVLKNNSSLTLFFKVNGLENFNDDFYVDKLGGEIGPESQIELTFRFSPIKTFPFSKKILKIEISEHEVGIIDVINFTVNVEAVDLALDIAFAKGFESSTRPGLGGTINLGNVRVGEEIKNSLILRNRGKYEIDFRFEIDQQMRRYFTVNPLKGHLPVSDRPHNVTLIFKSHSMECQFRDKLFLKCFIYEFEKLVLTTKSKTKGLHTDQNKSYLQLANAEQKQECIVCIPIKCTVSAVLPKVSISPDNEIDFGALISGNKKISNITLENVGIHEFRFLFSKMKDNQSKKISIQSKKSSVFSIGKKESFTSSSINRLKSTRNDGLQSSFGSKCNIGPFIIHPCSGLLSPLQKQVIYCEFQSESGRPKHYNETIRLDVLDKNFESTNAENFILYNIRAESCLSNFSTDVNELFELNRIFKTNKNFTGNILYVYF